jgi:hypothetical protein
VGPRACLDPLEREKKLCYISSILKHYLKKNYLFELSISPCDVLIHTPPVSSVMALFLKFHTMKHLTNSLRSYKQLPQPLEAYIVILIVHKHIIFFCMLK